MRDLGQALLDLRTKARAGDDDILAAAKALGLTADQLKSEDLPGLLLKLQEAYDRNGDSANRFAAMQKLLGNVWEQLYPQFQQGAAFLAGLYAAADRSGASAERLKDSLAGTVATAQQAGAAWAELKASFEGFVLSLQNRFKGAIDGLILLLRDLVDDIAGVVEGFNRSAQGANNASPAFDAFQPQ